MEYKPQENVGGNLHKKNSPDIVKCRKKTMPNNFTCNWVERVSDLGVEYQFDYNYKSINSKS